MHIVRMNVTVRYSPRGTVIRGEGLMMDGCQEDCKEPPASWRTALGHIRNDPDRQRPTTVAYHGGGLDSWITPTE